jgi:hypothetical protein
LKNLGFAVGTSLVTSTIYFLISPLNQAHSELFARTSPTIYDVLIAFFGGLAGIIAITSKNKGNALQGAAIATALMPPLCTAGYGIATWQWNFFFGATFLFIINSVFISLATFISVRLLGFPEAHASNPRTERIIRNTVFAAIIFTVGPSLWFGYELTEKERFTQKANQFLDREFSFERSFVLQSEIDYSKKRIEVVMGGKEVDTTKIADLTRIMSLYGLESTSLVVLNKLALQPSELADRGISERVSLLNREMQKKGKVIEFLQSKIDSLESQEEVFLNVAKEVKIQYPQVQSVQFFPGYQKEKSKRRVTLILGSKPVLASTDREKLRKWLIQRLNAKEVQIADL